MTDFKLVPAGLIEREFPLFDDNGLDENKHHCEWALQQDRKRLHAMLAAAPQQAAEQMENAAYVLGVIEMGLALKQLCSDFSDRANRPYMKDVTDAIASLAGQVANEGRDAHSDDLAVDLFAHAMKQKLAQKREQGRGGWETCPPEILSKMLIDHIAKGDPVDVANFCMMLHQTGNRIVEQPRPVPTCDWQEDSDGIWETSCGEAWVCTEGTPAENNMKYCHSCGKHLKEHRYAEPDGGAV